MASTRVHFTVDVDCPLDNGEVVMVSGSVEPLGLWDPQLGLTLSPHPDIPGRWFGFIDTTEESLKYRYFTGYKLFGECERLIVSEWESHLNPRSIVIKANKKGSECRLKHVDLFEYYAGRRSVREGWLQFDEENQILLSLHGKALKFYKAERKNCRIRVTPLDVRSNQTAAAALAANAVVEEEADEDEDCGEGLQLLPSHSTTTVTMLSSASSNCKFQKQPPNGVTFNNLRDYLVFKTRSIAVEFLAFLLEIFTDDGKRIGSCYALPSSLSDSSGSISLPFINNIGRPIGQIMVEYLFIRILRREVPKQLMDVSFSRHWKKRTTLEVGHRGAGNSYTKLAMARENTVHSLNMAAKNGADYVEFDVQLTKDKIAVIYHDFHVLVSVSTRNAAPAGSRREATAAAASEAAAEREADFHEMAVKDLKLAQLQLLKMEHLEYSKNVEGRKKLMGEESEGGDLRPFPTLVDALCHVDPDVGFNVEVKYPMMQEDGFHECAHYFERNEFVDVILADLLNNAGERRIMFSSFDPDICSLLSMKQNRYPVLFLCVGETQRYARFKDQRCSTSLAAVNFASAAEILGVNFNSEDLLKEPRPVRRAAELGLVSFVWGEDLDERDNIDYFKKELGVDGLIYDRIGEQETRSNVFIVEREVKKKLFHHSSSNSSPPRSASPLSSSAASLASSASVAFHFSDRHHLDALHEQAPPLESSESECSLTSSHSTLSTSVPTDNSASLGSATLSVSPHFAQPTAS